MSLDAHEFFTQEVTNVGLLQVPVLVNPMTKTSYKYINDIRSETQLGKVMLYKKMSESSELVESLDEKKIEADHHIESKYVVVKVSNLRLVGKMVSEFILLFAFFHFFFSSCNIPSYLLVTSLAEKQCTSNTSRES
jgi:hypothetical protein